MKTLFKIFWRTFLVLLLLSNYAALTLFISLNHNHEPDFIFHDNCPACQWELQKKSDDTCTKTILNALIDPLDFTCYTPINTTIIIDKQDFRTDNFSRAPPRFS